MSVSKEKLWAILKSQIEEAYQHSLSTPNHQMKMSEKEKSLKLPLPTGEIPSAEKQRHIITSLEGDEESLHVYCVSKQWYEKWKKYVGLNDHKKPDESEYPGQITMDNQDEENNTLIDEKIWKKWVKWFGISDAHELDRRNFASDDKTFEICILNPYSGIVQNPLKTIDISELTGYVELQLRKIFKVAKHRETRLWTCEKLRNARFHLLFDRTQQLCFQDQLDTKREYILAIEIGNLDGSWPTHVPGETKGDFDRYRPVTEGPQVAEFWEQELTTAVKSVFNGISAELNETVTGIVSTSKCITTSKEKDLARCQDKVDHKLKHISETQKALDHKLREVSQHEESARDEVKKVKKDREKMEMERVKFEAELKRMQELNKIQDARVKLDIGGNSYMTSLLTLTKDPDSMLAAMFSGRHALKREPDGSYFIDRDGTHFRYILNYLRDGGFREGTLPTDKGILNELLTEAHYYQISGLAALLEDRMKVGEDDEDDSRTIMRSNQSSQKKPSRKIALKK